LNTNLETKQKAHRAKPQGIRLPDDLLERVDGYAEKLSSEIHFTVSRADAIRRLLVLGLEDAEDIRDAEQAMKEPGAVTLLAVKTEYGL
jgi:predicted DNA-binding protein